MLRPGKNALCMFRKLHQQVQIVHSCEVESMVNFASSCFVRLPRSWPRGIYDIDFTLVVLGKRAVGTCEAINKLTGCDSRNVKSCVFRSDFAFLLGLGYIQVTRYGKQIHILDLRYSVQIGGVCATTGERAGDNATI